MNRAQLKELLRQAIYEKGETKRRNKAMKKDFGFGGDAIRRNIAIDRDIMKRSDSRIAAMDPEDYEKDSDYEKHSKDWGTAHSRATAASAQLSRGAGEPSTDMLAAKGQFPSGAERSTAFTASDRQLRGPLDPSRRSNLQYQGTEKATGKPLGGRQQNSPVPPQVQQAASKDAGGKVRFGRYYDAQGNYLGRSQGGQWVDAASDPNAKTQLEMYQKLMEIESGHYSSKDKEMVKELLRQAIYEGPTKQANKEKKRQAMIDRGFDVDTPDSDSDEFFPTLVRTGRSSMNQRNVSGTVPPQVKKAASKEAGGRVVFGRYYDAQGNYLGRSQGGKWVDAASDPNAKTQMEMYQKLMEIESGHYSSKDKEMVKEMIREVMKSCK
jgi:hypothetical protein